ncbi:MAG: hypothetical protein V7608_1425 [Hyphomicrobiales bacterium]|jgi:uncharacterized metal-binding protein YceD (DUF177 family)
MSEAAAPWSVPIKLADITEAGRRVTVEADAATRAALAGALGVDSVQRASATFDLSHWGRDGLHVAGRVSATVGQSCVVTLEPVVNEINEEVDVDFAPEPAAVARPKSEDEAPSSIEGPEPLAGDSIDVGALATEYLILGVDPYPRKPGIAFDAPKTGEKTGEEADDATAGNPFAALAALKKGTVKE